ncbi:MAG: hypothetical protein HY000_29710 [Planctomycetes bacterium]|nr:hypothetical protein [Planctomycetota bacterium]
MGMGRRLMVIGIVRSAAVVRMAPMMGMLIRFDSGSLVRMVLRLLALRMRMARGAHADRKLQRQHHCGHKCEQLGQRPIHDFGHSNRVPPCPINSIG